MPQAVRRLPSPARRSARAPRQRGVLVISAIWVYVGNREERSDGSRHPLTHASRPFGGGSAALWVRDIGRRTCRRQFDGSRHPLECKSPAIKRGFCVRWGHTSGIGRRTCRRHFVGAPSPAHACEPSHLGRLGCVVGRRHRHPSGRVLRQLSVMVVIGDKEQDGTGKGHRNDPTSESNQVAAGG
jgi:hypothetical protein